MLSYRLTNELNSFNYQYIQYPWIICILYKKFIETKDKNKLINYCNINSLYINHIMAYFSYFIFPKNKVDTANDFINYKANINYLLDLFINSE